MKRLLLALMVVGLAVFLADPALCGEVKEAGGDDPHRYGMMKHGRGMGRGPMMDDDFHGCGMEERGRCYMRPKVWHSLTPEQQEKCKKMRAAQQMETLELRKQLAAKRIELKTLWKQPKIDRARIEKLSDEIAELSAELSKKRNKYLLKCREELGDLGWCCPGGKW
ncbi:MAG: periplasmic heavy metal sensor [Deltaproteobacteria bacterium]|nr:MAG: periplasmic heavy metal sensor [Deltaproteobacteria bacterium]